MYSRMNSVQSVSEHECFGHTTPEVGVMLIRFELNRLCEILKNNSKLGI